MSGDSDNDRDELRAELRALAARVAKLEAERGTGRRAPPPVSTEPQAVEDVDDRAPPPLPSPPPIAAPSATVGKSRGPKPRRARTGAELERFVGLTVLGRVGIVAVIAAAAYFGQLGWARLGPGARASLVYVLGAVLIAVGAVLRKRVAERYVALLWGGGTAVTYVAGVLAYLRFAVVSSTVAILSLLVSAALGQWLAHRLQLQVMATVALAGAYAAPVLVGTPSPSPTGFFVLLLTLHTWAAWTEHRWQWRFARAVAAAATVVLVIGWYADNGTGSPVSFAIHVEVVWLLLAAPELLRAALRVPVSEWRAIGVFVAGLLANFALMLERDMPAEFGAVVSGVLLLSAALLVPRGAAVGAWLGRTAAVLLPPALVLLLAHPDRVVADEWAFAAALGGAGVLQLIIRRWTLVGELGAGWAAAAAIVLVAVDADLGVSLSRAQTPLLLLAPLALLVCGRGTTAQLFGLSLGIAACFAGWWRPRELAIDEWGCASLALVAAAAVATLASLLAARRRAKVLGSVAAWIHALLLLGWLAYFAENEVAPGAESATAFYNVRFVAIAAMVALAVAARTQLSVTEPAQRLVLGIVALVGTYLGGLLELLDIASDWRFGAHAAVTSLYSLAFAGVLSGAGFRWQSVGLRWAALAGFAAIAIKVAVHDLSRADTPIRVLITGVLGGVLMLVAWAYARRQRRDAGSSPPE